MLSPIVHSVSQVAVYLKDKLESDGLLSRLTVQGEIANLRTVASGHSYFTLREDGSSIRCVMFRGRAGQEYLEDGQEILAGGNFTFYPPSGEANMQVAAVLPVGAGALALELARLRQQLAAEGLFDPSRKRPVPVFPRVIGVVTSPSGAVWQDIQNVVMRRYPLAELRLSPSAVQGDFASAQIAEAIRSLNDEAVADVIIVARGGGSLEDLWCFNSEEVARAIFASSIPIVSGVGHETDTTIADEVADSRAPTPSAAAELVTPDRNQILAGIFGARQQMTSVLTGHVARLRSSVLFQQQRLQRRAPDVASMRRRVDEYAERATSSIRHRHILIGRDVATLVSKLGALNPADTLRRGYAVVRLSDDGLVLTSPDQATDGSRLDISLAGGTLSATAGHHSLSPVPEDAPVDTQVSPVASDGAAAPTPRKRSSRRSPAPPPAMKPLL
jgi:exodeoxyribonuclease VII large subunit